MMDEATEELSGELAEELATNDVAARYVDPRTIPTRYSLLKKLDQSPAHYLEACQQPQDDSLAARLASIIPGPDKRAALRFGNATHAMLFETGTVAVMPPDVKVRRGAKWDAAYRQAAEDGHVEILGRREYAMAVEIVNAIRKNAMATRLLFDGTIVEKRIDWKWGDKEVRSTPDARKPGHWLVDLKTAVSSQPEAFRRQALRFGYHAQSSLYGEALDAIGESIPSDGYYLIAVEKTRPHPVTILRVAPEALEQGQKMTRLWFERLQACERANEWPEYLYPGAVASLHLDEDY